MKPTSSPVTDEHPISLTVLVVIADARKSTRVLARRGQAFATAPEALAAMPGHVNSLVRGAGGDALLELNKFLKLLAEPEPPAEEPPPAPACPPPPSCVVPEPEIPVAEPALEPPAEPPAPVEGYLIPLALPLLS